MSSSQTNIMLIGAIVLAGVTASLAIRYCAQSKLRDKRQLLLAQNTQIADLEAQHKRLSNLIAHAQGPPAQGQSAEAQTAELAKLRAEAEALRKRTDALDKQPIVDRVATHRASSFAAITRHPGSFHVVSDENSDEYAVQLYKVAAGERNRFTGDARNLSWAVREFARENQGQVPANFDQAAPYAYKGNLPLAGSYKERDTMAGVNDFEIVFQGSLNDLANIPHEAVALIRQRQPWATPNGKSGRIYTMADGRLYVVESDDNFYAWEAEHVIPPPPAR